MPVVLNKSVIKRTIIKFILRRNLPVSLLPPQYTLPIDTETIDDVAAKLGFVPCNVNFDDLCTQYGGKLGLDFGGSIKEGLSQQFGNLLCDYPDVAFTVFMIPAGPAIPDNLWDYVNLKKYPDISSPANRKWLEYYKNLAKEFHIEYAMHGCYHYQYENPLFSRHTEFAFKDESQCRRVIQSSLDIFAKAGLNVCGFRPPGWGLNSDMSLIKVLKELNFDYVAASSIDAGLNAGQPRVSDYYPTIVDGIINFPQNVLLDWTIEKMQHQIDKIVAMKGLISIKGHFVDKKIPNCLSSQNIAKLRSILDYLSQRCADSLEYITFRDLTKKIA